MRPREERCGWEDLRDGPLHLQGLLLEDSWPLDWSEQVLPALQEAPSVTPSSDGIMQQTRGMQIDPEKES